MRRFESFRDLLRDGERLVNGNSPARDTVRERRPLDQFHDEGFGPVGLFQAIDGGDVGMVQRREGLGFALEAGDPVGVTGERCGQDLDCDITIQLRVPRPVQLPHPAHADLGSDSIWTRPNAGDERHDPPG